MTDKEEIMKLSRANANLKECPFCGSKVHMEDNFIDRAVDVRCPKCGIQMIQTYKAEESAVELLLTKWNDRT